MPSEKSASDDDKSSVCSYSGALFLANPAKLVQTRQHPPPRPRVVTLPENQQRDPEQIVPGLAAGTAAKQEGQNEPNQEQEVQEVSEEDHEDDDDDDDDDDDEDDEDEDEEGDEQDEAGTAPEAPALAAPAVPHLPISACQLIQAPGSRHSVPRVASRSSAKAANLVAAVVPPDVPARQPSRPLRQPSKQVPRQPSRQHSRQAPERELEPENQTVRQPSRTQAKEASRPQSKTQSQNQNRGGAQQQLQQVPENKGRNSNRKSRKHDSESGSDRDDDYGLDSDLEAEDDLNLGLMDLTQENGIPFSRSFKLETASRARKLLERQHIEMLADRREFVRSTTHMLIAGVTFLNMVLRALGCRTSFLTEIKKEVGSRFFRRALRKMYYKNRSSYLLEPKVQIAGMMLSIIFWDLTNSNGMNIIESILRFLGIMKPEEAPVSAPVVHNVPSAWPPPPPVPYGAPVGYPYQWYPGPPPGSMQGPVPAPMVAPSAPSPNSVSEPAYVIPPAQPSALNAAPNQVAAGIMPLLRGVQEMALVPS